MSIRSITSPSNLFVAVIVVVLAVLLVYTISTRQSPSGKALDNQARLQKTAAQLRKTAQKNGNIGAKSVSPLRHILPQVYRLQVDAGDTTRGGSAFLVNGRRVVATNFHVVQDGKAFWLSYLDQFRNSKRMPLRILALYPQKDLALLETLDDLPGKALLLASKLPEAPDALFAVGFPAAADQTGASYPKQANDTEESYYIPSVLRGYVSRVLPNRRLTTQLQHQTPIVPGYSGGPLVNESGRVVGISTSVHKTAQGISYGVLATDLANLISACNLPVPSNDAIAHANDFRISAQLAPGAVNTHAQSQRPDVSNETKLLDRAIRLLHRGNITAAQSICRNIASKHAVPEAFLCLAKSHDPKFLEQIGAFGPKGNLQLSRSYYELAKHTAKLRNEATSSVTASKLDTAFPRCDDSLCAHTYGRKGFSLNCERR
ncbi:MAG: serine protease [Alphaproteobacteria bacterium]